MTTEEALAELGIEMPWGRKLSCPKHSDSDPSLHVYPGDKGWYCFSCATGGDGWSLLAHYYDRPVAELMRDRGVKLGPRPRSRWEQLDAIETRGWDVRHSFHRDVKALWNGNMPRVFGAVQHTEGVIEYLYGTDILARYFPEDKPPYLMDELVNDLELFLADELGRQRGLHEMSLGL